MLEELSLVPHDVEPLRKFVNWANELPENSDVFKRPNRRWVDRLLDQLHELLVCRAKKLNEPNNSIVYGQTIQLCKEILSQMMVYLESNQLNFQELEDETQVVIKKMTALVNDYNKVQIFN